MRLILPTLAAALLFTGCSKSTAFDFFKIDAEHERAISNLRTETIVRSFETKAIISSVYLNRVKPERFSGNEYFFIAVYLPERLELFDAQGHTPCGLSLTLDGILPHSVSTVDDKDPIRTLMPIRNDWNRYYIVEYPASEAETMTLILESDQYGEARLAYPKDPE